MIPLDALPTEVLEQICKHLSLSDRKALSETNRRMESVVMQPRFTNSIVLRLNRMTGQRRTSIRPDVIRSSRRKYQSVRLELYQHLEQLGEMLNTLNAHQTLVTLEVTDRQCMQIVRLYRMCRPVFETLETLVVRNVGSTIVLDGFSGPLSMPALRSIVWIEDGIPYTNQAQYVQLHAPRLEMARFPQPFHWYDILLSALAGVYKPQLQLGTHLQLRQLTLCLSINLTDVFPDIVLPALVDLTIHFNNLLSVFFDGPDFVHNLSNLQRLTLVSSRREPLNIFSGFLSECPSLRTLVLRGCTLNMHPQSPWAWGRIQKLHIHHRIAGDEWKMEACFLHMTVLQTLSLRLGFNGHMFALRLRMPVVRDLTICCYSDQLDVLHAPLIETLRLRVPRQINFTFMGQGNQLPYLHTLVLETNIAKCSREKLLGSVAPALANLTIVCRVGSSLDSLLHNIDQDLPNLKSLSIAGNQNRAVLLMPTLLSICRLANLKTLRMKNLMVRNRSRQTILLPASLEDLTMSNICIPSNKTCTSPFVVHPHHQFTVQSKTQAGNRVYSCNEEETSNTWEQWCCSASCNMPTTP